MRILVVCQHYYPEPFRITDICEKLVQRGHEVTVLTAIPNYPEGVFYPGYSKSERREETLNGVHVIRCYAPPRGKRIAHRFRNYLAFPRNASKVAKRLGGDFDVVFAYQLSPIMMAKPGLAYKKKYGTKVLLYELDPWPSNLTAGGIKESSPIFQYFASVSRQIYLGADKVLVSSKPHIDYIQKLCRQSLPISYLPQYASDVGEYLSFSSEESHFLYAGNVGQALPIEIMLSAFKKAHESNPGVFLDIAGDGSALDEAKEYCKVHAIENVCFHGWLSKEDFKELSSKCKAAIVLLNHQFYSQSTVPGKVQTYLKIGFPILAADDGATKQIIEESHAGICVPTSIEDELVKAILKYASMPEEELRQYSENGKAYYEKEMSESGFFETLEKELQKLCKK